MSLSIGYLLGKFMQLNAFDRKSSLGSTNEVVKTLARWHLLQLGNLRLSSIEQGHFDSVQTFIESGDFGSLVRYTMDPGTVSLHVYRHLCQILAYYQKRADLDIGIDRELVGLQKLAEAESLNRKTNDLFKGHFDGGIVFPPRVESVLYRAQRKISAILGECPELADLKLRLGPGATTQVKKSSATPHLKFAEINACSRNLIPLLPEVLGEMPCRLPFTSHDESFYSDAELDRWLEGEDSDDVRELLTKEFYHQKNLATRDTVRVPVEVHQGKLVFVPKNAKTDRSVIVEPMLNIMCQLAYGDYMSDRLRSVGVDVSDQTRNQSLAKLGSLTGALATLDLSNASNTLSRELVYHLLPIDWALRLDQIRTDLVSYKGKVYELEMFSSMGNGFTFQLETLIFYALAHACANEDPSTSVYGDDIIVRTEAVPLLTEVLTTCGFILNKEKSFVEGPFRESCGRDYYSGISVRPVFVKDRLSISDLYVLHNFFSRDREPELAQIVLSFIPPVWRLYGPDGYGDGHLLGDCVFRPHNRKLGWSGYTFETLTRSPRRHVILLPGDHVFALYNTYVGGSRDLTSHWAYPTVCVPEEFARHLRVRRKPVYELPESNYLESKGRLGLPVPGYDRVNRIKIYVLTA